MGEIDCATDTFNAVKTDYSTGRCELCPAGKQCSNSAASACGTDTQAAEGDTGCNAM